MYSEKSLPQLVRKSSQSCNTHQAANGKSQDVKSIPVRKKQEYLYKVNSRVSLTLSKQWHVSGWHS